jgi:hypothetical protein
LQNEFALKRWRQQQLSIRSLPLLIPNLHMAGRASDETFAAGQFSVVHGLIDCSVLTINRAAFLTFFALAPTRPTGRYAVHKNKAKNTVLDRDLISVRQFGQPLCASTDHRRNTYQITSVLD